MEAVKIRRERERERVGGADKGEKAGQSKNELMNNLHGNYNFMFTSYIIPTGMYVQSVYYVRYIS